MNKDLYDQLQKEREISNRAYAVKIVEKIVFALVTLICLAVIAAWLSKIIIK